MSRARDIEFAICEGLGADAMVREATAIGGGCISSAFRVTTHRGDFFLKLSSGAGDEMFRAEAIGLQALAQSRILRIPQVIGHGELPAGRGAWLLLEHISPGDKPADFFSRFGRLLARLHLEARHPQCGFPTNNFIGSTPQKNTWSPAWIDFFREQRLCFQLDLAARNGFHGELQKRGLEFLAKLGELMSEPEGDPCLLHGDLWGGNYLGDSSGNPVLIDPAVHYGHREADLAMTQLFGGFPDVFLDAYQEVWPLESGWKNRFEIYQLYHQLNHLNLFGSSYLSGCLQTLRKFT